MTAPSMACRSSSARAMAPFMPWAPGVNSNSAP